MTRLPPDIAALREGVGLAHETQLAIVRIDGPGAAALLAAVATTPPPRRDGLATPALLLRPDATVLADVLVCADDGGFLLLAENIPAPALTDHLRTYAADTTTIRDLTTTHTVLSFHGPFAWEPVGWLVGPEVLGVPPMTSFRLDPLPGLGLRVSKTGEYGYALLVPQGDPALAARLAELRDRYPVTDVDLPALDLCGLENGFYNARAPGLTGLTPVELQLQWRLRNPGEFVGHAALRAHQAAPGRRITWFLGEPATPPPPVGTTLHLAGRAIGPVVHAAHSPVLGRPIGLALLDRAWAHPHLPCTQDTGDLIMTTAPPLINNRSMHVRPQQHRLAARDQYTFPALTGSHP